MDDQTFHPERPPDETWWERELTRNEKLMDKYLSVFHQNPEWFANHPEDLYQQVHSGEQVIPSIDIEEEDEDEREDEDYEYYLIEEEEEEEEEKEFILEDFDPELEEEFEEEPAELDDEQTAHYPQVAKQAQEFALRVFDLKNLPLNADVLYLSAGKVGANLAGGHGLGYDEETLCGNIVKCKWALGDCRFCSEMLDLVHSKTADPGVEDLLRQSRQLEATIQERIERLRARVWW
jgi:hypothetical protein